MPHSHTVYVHSKYMYLRAISRQKCFYFCLESFTRLWYWLDDTGYTSSVVPVVIESLRSFLSSFVTKDVIFDWTLPVGEFVFRLSDELLFVVLSVFLSVESPFSLLFGSFFPIRLPRETDFLALTEVASGLESRSFGFFGGGGGGAAFDESFDFLSSRSARVLSEISSELFSDDFFSLLSRALRTFSSVFASPDSFSDELFEFFEFSASFDFASLASFSAFSFFSICIVSRPRLWKVFWEKKTLIGQ